MKQVTYRDLLNIKTTGSNEVFVKLSKYGVINYYLSSFNDMKNVLGDSIIVRKQVAENLSLVQNYLNIDRKYSVLVTFGYRSLQIQTERFQQRLSEITLEKFYSDPVDLYEEVHKNIAVPTVAGHPTGGAVDVTLIDKNGDIVDMGAPMYDYSEPGYETFAENTSEEAKKNRMILRVAMMQAGFAPFDGEYWHFSYGDKEWAFYYDQTEALYEQVSVEEVENMLEK